LLACIRHCGPLPVILIAPIYRIGKSKRRLSVVQVYAAAAMIEVQVRQEHIRHIIRGITSGIQRPDQRIIAVQIVKTQKPGVLLVAYTIVDKDAPVSVFHQEATHGPCAEILFVSRVQFIPNGFWYYTEHGATVQFEEACIDNRKLHNANLTPSPHPYCRTYLFAV